MKAVAALVALALLLVLPASAGQSAEPCRLELGGEPTSPGEAVVVDEDADLPYRLIAQRPIREYTIDMEFGPVPAEVASGTGSSSEVRGTIAVSEHTMFGIGIYDIEAHMTLDDGSTCSVRTLLLIEGNPFATVAGLVAGGILVGGLAGLIAAIVIGFMDLKEIRDAVKDYREEHQRHRRWDQDGSGSR